jgi:hypothetical protein
MREIVTVTVARNVQFFEKNSEARVISEKSQCNFLHDNSEARVVEEKSKFK